MLSWVSEVAVYTGKQLGFSRPQMRMTTISSRSMPREVPSRRKLWPGRSGEPCGQRHSGCVLQCRQHPRPSVGQLWDTVFLGPVESPDLTRTHPGESCLQETLGCVWRHQWLSHWGTPHSKRVAGSGELLTPPQCPDSPPEDDLALVSAVPRKTPIEQPFCGRA